jgi:hypothetical protein
MWPEVVLYGDGNFHCVDFVYFNGLTSFSFNLIDGIFVYVELFFRTNIFMLYKDLFANWLIKFLQCEYIC